MSICLVTGTATLTLGLIHLMRDSGGGAVVVALSLSALLFSLPFILRHTGNHRLVCHLLLLILTVLMLGAGAMRGGLGTPATMAIGGVPMLAILLIDGRAAVRWLCVSVGALCLLLYAQSTGRIGVDLVNTELHPFLNFGVAVVFILFLFGIGWAYEQRRTEAMNELEARKQALHETNKAKSLAEMDARLTRAEHLASIGQLAAGAAHEINNPLAYILSNLSTVEAGLRSGHLPTHDTIEAIRDALVGAKQIDRVVRDLKNFSRLDEDDIGPVDIHDVIETVLKMAHTETAHRAIIERYFGENVPAVHANHARVSQILLNIVINAAQAIPVGSRRQHSIAITTTREGDLVCIEVKDTGVGISLENLSRVTEPFYTTKPAGKGTGLGLSAASNLVRRLGGELRIESVPKEGTTVQCLLPISHSTILQASPDAFEEYTTEPLRILVIDDDRMVVRALRRMLADHDVVSVGSGEEALTLLEEDACFELVLCDLMMPEMSGIDVYLELKQVQPDIIEVMVFMTGGVFSSRVRDFLQSGEYRLLDKPFAPQKLAEQLQWAATRRPSRSRAKVAS